MADDPLKAAFRGELATIKTANSITWETKDVENVFATADGLTNFLCLEFAAPPPWRRMSIGNPGNDLWLASGTVFVRLVAPLNGGRATIEDYATKIHRAFLGRTFATAGGETIRCDSGPADVGGHGVRWIATVSVDYRMQTRG